MTKPEIVVIAGPNGSGKSTYTEFSERKKIILIFLKILFGLLMKSKK